jgi:hypothetical protein
MKNRLFVTVILAFVAALLVGPGPASAFWLNKDKTIEMKGKLQSRVSVSTEDTKSITAGGVKGFTSPEVDAWELVQHRNIAYIEFNHELKNHGWAGVNLQYHLLGRFMYEGIYDYGINEFKDLPDLIPAETDIDDFRQDADLWEGYVDISKGGLFLRIGRQNLAWGETDLFRILDNINPLDQTYGGIFEDLDDRRIPLDMVRVNYDFGNVGPVYSFTLEGYLAPGFIEDTVSPWAPQGTRYSYPLPMSHELLGPTFANYDYDLIEPEKEMENSRFGIRHTGILFDNFNYTLAFMRTVQDVPSPRYTADFTDVGPGAPAGPVFASLTRELIYDTQDIIGASVNFYEPHTDLVFRIEAALFKDEKVFIPGENAAPIAFLLGGPFATEGTIPTRDVVRYMIGVDKFQWIRFLNPNSTFFISLQYFGQYMDDHSDDIFQAVPLAPAGATYPEVKEFEHTFTGLISSPFRQGALEPQLAVVYDVRGAWMFQPQVNFKFDPFRLMLQYSTISGERTSIGHFKDRDQATAVLTYVF